MSEKHLQSGDPMPPLTDGSLHLFSMKYCPYAQRPRLVLHAKGINYEEINCNLSNKPEFLFKLNPLGKVPVLEVNGKVVVESNIICDLLDELYPDPPLYPKDPFKKAEDKMLMEVFSSKVIPSFYKFAKSGRTDEEAITNLLDGLAIFDAELKKRGTPFLGGQLPGMLDLNIWPFNERLVVSDKLTDLIKAKLPDFDAYCRRMEATAAVKPVLNSKEVHQKFSEGYSTRIFQYEF